MKTIFDLREKQDDEVYEAIQNLFDESLKVVKLATKSITACIGCWNCWLKTPGRCVIKDQMAESYPDYVNSDSVILLIDTAQGFINHKAKAFLDRTIPHYHPYIKIVDGECHHVARYNFYPDMIFYYDKGMEIFIKVLAKIGLINFFWDQQLKKNNAYEKRFDCPYLTLNKESSTV